MTSAKEHAHLLWDIISKDWEEEKTPEQVEKDVAEYIGKEIQRDTIGECVGVLDEVIVQTQETLKRLPISKPTLRIYTKELIVLVERIKAKFTVLQKEVG